MLNAIINPEPYKNPAIRRQMFQVTGFATILLSALLAVMIAAFVGLLPNWPGWRATVAIALTGWFLFGRSDSLRRR